MEVTLVSESTGTKTWGKPLGLVVIVPDGEPHTWVHTGAYTNGAWNKMQEFLAVQAEMESLE